MFWGGFFGGEGGGEIYKYFVCFFKTGLQRWLRTVQQGVTSCSFKCLKTMKVMIKHFNLMKK